MHIEKSFVITVLAPGIFVLLWSTGFIGAKFILPYGEPATILALRFSLVALLLVPVVWFTRSPWPESWREAGHITVSGILVHGVYLGGVFVGINLGLPVGSSALIVSLQPIITAMLIGPFLGRRLEAAQWVGFVIGTAGVLLVVTSGAATFSGEVLGLAFSVAAVLGIGVGTLYHKRYCVHMDLRTGSLIQFAGAALLMWACSAWFEEQVISWTPVFLMALAWLIIVLSLGAVTLLWLLVRYGAAERVASVFFMVPPVTAVLAWIFFGETMAVRAMAGMGLAAVGVFMVTRKSRPV